jgi:hypothetical protein
VEPAFGESPKGRAGRIEGDLRTLRARWRSASLASGWRFPSDWGLPEVDGVCAAVMRPDRPAAAAPYAHESAETALAGLARARAAAGAGLGETLADLAALHAVLTAPDGVDGFIVPDVAETPARLLWLTALAWADVATDQLCHTEVLDPLTGLPTAAYLRTRLGEIYRGAEKEGGRPGEEYLLLVVAMDFSRTPGWPRLTGMVLAADVLRTVFDGGESVAALGPSAVAALVSRDDRTVSRGVALRRELHRRLSVDPQLREVDAPRITAVRLPPTHLQACELVATLGHT